MDYHTTFNIAFLVIFYFKRHSQEGRATSQ